MEQYGVVFRFRLCSYALALPARSLVFALRSVAAHRQYDVFEGDQSVDAGQGYVQTAARRERLIVASHKQFETGF